MYTLYRNNPKSRSVVVIFSKVKLILAMTGHIQNITISTHSCLHPPPPPHINPKSGQGFHSQLTSSTKVTFSVLCHNMWLAASVLDGTNLDISMACVLFFFFLIETSLCFHNIPLIFSVSQGGMFEAMHSTGLY